MIDFDTLPKVDSDKAAEKIPKETGIYFFYNKLTDNIIYIGTGSGRYGLYNRIVRQHLNPKYIEYRGEKHTPLDFYQLDCNVKKVVKGELKVGIDQSAFRKNLGRNLHLCPGEPTVNYIKEHFYIRYHLVEDIDKLKNLEKILIVKFNPRFNISHKYKLSNRL